MLGVLTGEGLLMQEMRATQAHTDLAMVAESDQVGVRIRRAAAPAVDRLGGVRLCGRAGDGGHRGICSFPASESILLAALLRLADRQVAAAALGVLAWDDPHSAIHHAAALGARDLDVTKIRIAWPVRGVP